MIIQNKDLNYLLNDLLYYNTIKADYIRKSKGKFNVYVSQNTKMIV